MRFSSGSLAFTVLGWTPGLRGHIAGHVLPCDCLVGVYEMWTGELVEILDSCCDDCECHHVVNRVVRRRPRGDVTDTRCALVTSATDRVNGDLPE